MNTKQLYIFDFDGTLADTLDLCFMCFRETFLKYNHQCLSNAEIANHFGGSEAKIIAKLVQGSTERKQQALEFFYQLYVTNHHLFATCPEKIYQLLQHLKQEQKQLAIFTGKGRRSLEFSLQALNLQNYFDFTLCDDDITHSKPHPEGILKILDHFQRSATQAVFFGDSSADVQSGTEAGVETHQIEWISNPDALCIKQIVTEEEKA